MNTNTSAVAQIKQQIDEEYRAAQLGCSGYAQVSSHTFIEQRMRNIDGYRQQLTLLVGEQEATDIVINTIWPAT